MAHELPPPFDRSYWVVPGKLIAGCYPGAPEPHAARAKLEGLVRCQVDAVISLMEPDETDYSGMAFVPYDTELRDLASERGRTVEFLRYAIRDNTAPTVEFMTEILDRIDQLIAEKKIVYMHCWGGRGRTGAVVGCYVARHGMAKGDEALHLVQHLRRNDPTAGYPSPSTDAQRDMVRNWPIGRGTTSPTARAGLSLEHFQGCLLGLAVGDAVGTTLEFSPPGSFQPISDMVGGGPFRLKPGQWTDDTSMALCLAESLIETRDFDPGDQMERYLRWRTQGHLSSTGSCFDIGGTVASALRAFQRTGDPYSGSTNPRSAGNGSIMRLAPVPLAYAHNPREAMDRSADSSRTTHGARTAVDACRYLGGLIVGAVYGRSKEKLLAPYYSPAPDYWNDHPLCPEIDEIAAGSFQRRNPPEIKGRGYVVKSLEAALWALHHGASFAEGCLMAVNLGDDADTTGAVYGQVAGAFYGLEGIPENWRDKVARRDLILDFAEKLHALAIHRGRND
jgi:ADP-ribosylglycohydrolase/predicted protein tyrosine phosphatase